MPIQFNTNNPETTLQLVNADKQFIDLVNNRITGYGQIPYTVPQRLIIDIIKESARYFYRWYWRATEKTFNLLNSVDIINFINEYPDYGYMTTGGFAITLPSYVNIVKGIHLVDESKTISDMFIDSTRMIKQSSNSRGNTNVGIDSNLYLIDIACRLVAENAFRSVFNTVTDFRYNNITNQLRINAVIKNYVLECETNISIQYLYKDDLFIRHVIGCVKRELKRVLGSHTIILPGGATLNVEEICNNLEDIEKVEDLIKAGGGVGDLIMFG